MVVTIEIDMSVYLVKCATYRKLKEIIFYIHSASDTIFHVDIRMVICMHIAVGVILGGSEVLKFLKPAVDGSTCAQKLIHAYV